MSILQPIDTSHLRFLESVTLGPTSGNVTLAQSGDVFTGALDSDFEKWCTDKPGKATLEAEALVYEMKKDCTFADLFGSFGVDLHMLCWQQEQIRLFCQEHRHYLRQEGYGTFFLFEVDKKLFVARVRVDGDELEAYVYSFAYADVWRADCQRRVVVPQFEQ